MFPAKKIRASQPKFSSIILDYTLHTFSAEFVWLVTALSIRQALVGLKELFRRQWPCPTANYLASIFTTDRINERTWQLKVDAKLFSNQ
jgi:hypothetical protein